MSKFEISKSIFMHGRAMLFIIEMGNEIIYTIMFVLISLLLAG